MMDERKTESVRVLSSGTSKFECFAVYTKCFGDVLEKVVLAKKKCRVVIEYDPAEGGITRVFTEAEEVQPCGGVMHYDNGKLSVR